MSATRSLAFLNGYAACLTAIKDYDQAMCEAFYMLGLDGRRALLRQEEKNDTLIAPRLRAEFDRIERDKGKTPIVKRRDGSE